MNNYEDSHRKASDDYNNGTIDEKMCPVCGTILSGKVKFCTECGFNFSEKSKKAPSRSAGVAIAVAVIAALLTSLCCVFFFVKRHA